MMKLFCDCGLTTELPSNLVELAQATIRFYEAHNHFPEKVRFVCSCGAERVSGPFEQLDAFDRGKRDAAWLAPHLNGSHDDHDSATPSS